MIITKKGALLLFLYPPPTKRNPFPAHFFLYPDKIKPSGGNQKQLD